MARKSTKTAVNSTDAAIESKVEDIKTEDKAAETKVAEEKAIEEKAAEKKTGTAKKAPAKTAASKKEEAICSLAIQYGGKEISGESLSKKVKDIWKDELKRKAGDLNSIELYVKPEENKVFYVLNKEVTGNFDI